MLLGWARTPASEEQPAGLGVGGIQQSLVRSAAYKVETWELVVSTELLECGRETREGAVRRERATSTVGFDVGVP